MIYLYKSEVSILNSNILMLDIPDTVFMLDFT